MPYVIFEGPDGVGKSTAMLNLAKYLNDIGINTQTIQMPGHTPIGKHLRKLVKTPHLISPELADIDPHTRQLLYAADYSASAAWLKMNVAPDTMVLADRCSAISSLMYGEADGADVESLRHVYQGIKAPKADLLLIFNAPPQISISRMQGREQDLFDQKGLLFKQRVYELYNQLIDTKINFSTEYIQNITSKLIGIDAAVSEQKMFDAVQKAITMVLGLG